VLYRGSVCHALRRRVSWVFAGDSQPVFPYFNLVGVVRVIYPVAIQENVQDPAGRQPVHRQKRQLPQKMLRCEFFDRNYLLGKNLHLVYHSIVNHRDNICSFGAVLPDAERRVQASGLLQRRE